MGNFLKYENKFMQLIVKAVETIAIGVISLICSIPLFTIGASASALYYAYNKSIRQKKGYPISEFFSAFKNNFKKATIANLILLVILFIVISAIHACYFLKDAFPFIGLSFIVLMILSALIFIWACYLFPYLSRFQDSLKQATKNCILIMIANPIWTILLFLTFAVTAIGFIILTFMSGILGLFMPGLYIMIANLILEKVFRKYMKPEDLQQQKDYDNELG